MPAIDLPFGPGCPEWCPIATMIEEEPADHCRCWWDSQDVPCCFCGDNTCEDEEVDDEDG